MSIQQAVSNLQQHLSQRIIGQAQLVERLLIALLADGHLLVEGAPGLAKTKAINSLADGVEGDFQRIQFTPDLLPGDVTGTDIYRPEQGSFEFQKGPIFHNLVLADEINRAPAKVQSALLEAMAERQVSVGKNSYALPDLFLVMATQNPIEQEGTYPLPEAQLDRFLMHVTVDYPSIDAERRILKTVREELLGENSGAKHSVLQQEQLFEARQQILTMHCAESVEEYIVQLIMATRQPEKYSEELNQWIDYGASPRATLALDRCARAQAWLMGQDFVSPDNVQNVLADILRHRLILSFDAEANGISTDDVVKKILTLVPTA